MKRNNRNSFDLKLNLSQPSGRSYGFGGLTNYSNSRRSRRSSNIDKGVKENVWIKYMKNKTEGKCYCCKTRIIHFMRFDIGHNIPKSRGGSDNITNLRPICRPCNTGMGNRYTIEEYREKYYGVKPKVTRSSVSTRKKTIKAKKKKLPRRNNYGIPDLGNMNRRLWVNK